MTLATKNRCPNCGRPPVDDYRPFCSKRCADVDLGRWLDGNYRIPGAPATPEDMAQVGEDARADNDGDEPAK